MSVRSFAGQLSQHHRSNERVICIWRPFDDDDYSGTMRPMSIRWVCDFDAGHKQTSCWAAQRKLFVRELDQVRDWQRARLRPLANGWTRNILVTRPRWRTLRLQAAQSLLALWPLPSAFSPAGICRAPHDDLISTRTVAPANRAHGARAHFIACSCPEPDTRWRRFRSRSKLVLISRQLARPPMQKCRGQLSTGPRQIGA